MQQASHEDKDNPALPADTQNVKAAVSDWIEKTFLPAINSQVSLMGRHFGVCCDVQQGVLC